MVVENFYNDDLVMLLDKNNDELKSLRVFDTALEKLDKVGMTEIDHQVMLLDTEPFVTAVRQQKTLTPTMLRNQQLQPRQRGSNWRRCCVISRRSYHRTMLI